MDEQEFIRFYQSTRKALNSFILSLGVDINSCEDLIQDAYLKVLTKPPRKGSHNSRKSYLYTCAYRLFLNKKRKPNLGLIYDFNATTDDKSLQLEHQDELLHLLAPLSDRERSILWLIYAEGYNHQEVAEILSLSAKSIKVLVFRAKSKIRKSL